MSTETPWTDAANRLRNCGHEIEISPDKLAALGDLAATFITDIREGFLAQRDVADRLYEIAEAYGLCADHGDDRVQTALADGFDCEVQFDLRGKARSRLQPVSLDKFLALSIKPREMLLDPIIPEKGLAMLYASRGTGKTHVALGIAYAVAAGSKFLKWQAPRPRRVLLIDGEMPAAALQERLIPIAAETKPEGLKILAGDLLEEGGIGNLASPEVQAELDPWLSDIDLLILDNLSSLTAVIRDNDAESWGPIQEWLLRLRRRGLSVLIVHHAGKGGQQRGTSRREDVLDTSISLRQPEDYTPLEGARFEVHLEKARGILGDAARPFEAKLEVRDGAALWTMREIEDVNLARVKALLDDGLSVRDIADETGISKSAVQRLKKKADGGGTVAWDTFGTVGQSINERNTRHEVSQPEKQPGTVNVEKNQTLDPAVPLSQALGTGTVGHLDGNGAAENNDPPDLGIPPFLRRGPPESSTREIRHPAISSGPDDDLADFAP